MNFKKFYNFLFEYIKGTFFRKLSILFTLYVLLSIFSYEKEYTITSSINPASTQNSNPLTTLFQSSSNGTYFDFTDVIQSNYVLGKFLEESWINDEMPNEKQTVFSYYEIEIDEDDSLEEVHRKVIKKLKRELDITTSRLTGLIEVKLIATDETFGKVFLTFIQNESVNYINMLESDLSSQKISFLSERLSQIENELGEDEDNLKVFLEKNKNYSAPELQIEYLRLKRNVELQSVLLSTITSQLEVAKIENLDNLPSVVILDSPYIDDISSLSGNIIFYILCFIIINSFICFYLFYIRFFN